MLHQITIFADEDACKKNNLIRNRLTENDNQVYLEYLMDKFVLGNGALGDVNWLS